MTAKEIREQADHCRGRAHEMRAAAAMMTDTLCKSTLMAIANGYDTQADRLASRLDPGPGRWDVAVA